MKMIALELKGRMSVDVEHSLIAARSRLRSAEADVRPDHLTQAFKDRLRAAARASNPNAIESVSDVHLRIHVHSPLSLGLLHVAKVVSDALVAERWLQTDRAGVVSRISIDRQQCAAKDESLSAELYPAAGPASSPLRTLPVVQTPVHEWRSPTPRSGYVLDGRWKSPDEYRNALRSLWIDAEGSRIDSSQLVELASAGPHSLLARGLELYLRITVNRTQPFDLDNAALFVLDALALRLAEETGLHHISLDRLVPRVRVELGTAADTSFRVSLRHPALDRWTSGPRAERGVQ